MSPSRVATERSARYARWARSHFERGELSIAPRHQCAHTHPKRSDRCGPQRRGNLIGLRKLRLTNDPNHAELLASNKVMAYWARRTLVSLSEM
jgi:hypothetical protein